eukprot:TRINITY_DN37051_c0_g1_i1.p1 TRINITY_DN37051_c0_g1~~TRINITY_DN37051_c0_g1_i1.p1  ORF type:complete len:743 (-),score=216.29 TRINITY_DN37051_c0_g1_i1:238-2466(-)
MAPSSPRLKAKASPKLKPKASPKLKPLASPKLKAAASPKLGAKAAPAGAGLKKKKRRDAPVVADAAESGAASAAKAERAAKRPKASAEEKTSGAAAAASSTAALMKAKPLDEVGKLSKETKAWLTSRQITTLFEVQHRSFEPVFAGKDTVGRAKTGCGKTLAFVLPLVERIVADGLSSGKAGRKPLMLGLAPTRELARQIHSVLDPLAAVHSLKAACLYGGAPFGPQCGEVRAGLDCVIATPGRLLDHLQRDTLSAEAVRFVVLDEADEMLSMGFQEDVETILSKVPAGAQKLLFSATMPKWVSGLIGKHLKKDHTVVDVVGDRADNQANANITHQCISCSPMERGDTLADLCKTFAGSFGKTLVFTDTKKECDELAQHPTLIQMGAGQLHGDLPQNARDVTTENFRTGKIRILIATDVAARGLDIDNVELVVMVRPPRDMETYIHRSGRTGRGGKKGTCIVFYTLREEYMVRLLRKQKGIPIKRRGPPQPHEVVAQAARDCVRQLDTIHQDNVDAFTKVAEELLAERGEPTFILAAALAAMTGYTARIKSRSLLTSFEGSTAMILESDRGIDKTGKAWYLLRNMLPESATQGIKAMTLVKGGYSAIFDCPQDQVPTVLKAELWKGTKLSVAEELPELEAHESTSLADDIQQHREQQQRHWERIKGKKSDGDGKGGKGKGKDRDGDGKGKGKGKDKGKGKFKGKDGHEADSGGGGRGRGGGRGWGSGGEGTAGGRGGRGRGH